MKGLKILTIALTMMPTFSSLANEPSVTVTGTKLQGNPTLSTMIDYGIRVYLKDAKCEEKFSKEYIGDLTTDSSDSEYREVEHWRVNACGQAFDYKIKFNKESFGFDIVPFKA